MDICRVFAGGLTTMVSLFAFVSMLMLGMVSHAEDVDCTGVYKDKTDLDNKNPKPANLRDLMKAAMAKVEECEKRRDASLADCEKVKTSFKDLVKKTQEDCKGFKLESSADPGSISCSAAMDKCVCADKTVPATEKTRRDSICYDVKDEDLTHCPAKSEDKANRAAKKRDQAEERVTKLKDKIAAVESESDKADNNILDKQQQSKQALRKAEADHTQAVNEAKSSLSASQSSIATQLNGLRDKIFSTQQQVIDATLKDSAAYTAWKEQDLKIELGCTAQATQAVGVMQSEAVAAAKTGTYNRGSQADIFRQVGLTDRQSWQRQVGIRKRWCMDSEMTLGSKSSNQNTYNETIKGNAAAKRIAQEQMSLLNQQMSQLQNPDGSCGTQTANGAATTTQYCRDVAEANRKTKAADDALAAARKESEDDKLAAVVAQNKAARKNDKQLASLKADLIKREAELEKAIKEEEAAETFPRAGNRAPEAREMKIDFDKLKDRAGALNRCCKLSSGATPASPSRRDFIDENCGSAEKYLQARGFNTDLNLASGRSTSPPAPQSQPAPRTNSNPSGQTPNEGQVNQ